MLTIRNPTSPTRIAVSATRPAILYTRTIDGWSAIQNRGRLDRGCISMVPYRLCGGELRVRSSTCHGRRWLADPDLGGDRLADRLDGLGRILFLVAGFPARRVEGEQRERREQRVRHRHQQRQ